MKMLDIGCGLQKIPGAVGIDINPASQADVFHNLNQFPYPFEDNQFERIYGTDVLEHLDDVIRTMEEIHRIGRPGGQVFLRVPHFSSTHAFGDPTHKHFFNTESLDYFCGGFSKYSYDTSATFKKVRVKLNFWKLHRVDGVSFSGQPISPLLRKTLCLYFPGHEYRVSVGNC